MDDIMKALPLRMGSELLGAVKERAGARGVNSLVVALLEEWLLRTTPGMTSTDDIKRPTDIKEGEEVDISGYRCSYWHRGATCGAQANRFVGRLARCEAH